jgi:hypothetical protein
VIRNILYKEWLPDLPELNNPGLTVADDVIPDVDCYRKFNVAAEFSVGFLTAPATAVALAFGYDSLQSNYIYAASPTRIYSIDSTSTGTLTAKTSTLNAASNDWDFLQYESLMIAVQDGEVPLKHTVGSSSNFSTLASSGTAPSANCIGRVGQFVVLGHLTDGTDRPSSVAWGAIDNPESWPTPNSATAIAQQSGEQYLDQQLGQVMAIASGDQYGVILQKSGVTRMTYVGPPVVFQFDVIDRERGLQHRHGAVKVGGIVYYVSNDGFYATDGVTVVNIGLGKCNKYFISIDTGSDVRACFDKKRNCVLWFFNINSSTTRNKAIAYNVLSKNFSTLNIAASAVATAPTEAFFYAYNRQYQYFGGVASSVANLVTGEFEVEPGYRALVTGLKPLVTQDGSNAAPTIVGGMVYRNSLTDQTTSTSFSSITAATGFMDNRIESRYQRISLNITERFGQFFGVALRFFRKGKR